MNKYKFDITWHRTNLSTLTAEEHGAYRLLLDEYMLKECPLPKNKEHLLRIANTEEPVLNYVLAMGFVETSDGYVHTQYRFDKTPINLAVRCPQDKVLDLFHKMLPELPRIVIWNSQRESFLKARWHEMSIKENWADEEQGLAWFTRLFKYVRKSKFLMGNVQGKDRRAFECTLEWILRPSNFAKIIEGKYHEA